MGAEMPANKRQHFVPKAYLRPFASNEERSAIHVFNVARKKAIRDASLKGQCAKDYFYGADQRLEKHFQGMESKYAIALARIRGASVLDASSEAWLRAFTHMQRARTEMAVKRYRDGTAKLKEALYAQNPSQAPNVYQDDQRLAADSILMAAQTYKYVADLKVCVLENETAVDFITSDDPCFLANRFHTQRSHGRSYGLASSGAQLFLPLTPRLALVFYDGLVYTLPGRGEGFVSLPRVSDVRAVNELQYLAASENIYFSKWEDAGRIGREFDEDAGRRLSIWHAFNAFVPVSRTVDGEILRRATEEERLTARRSMIQSYPIYPEPTRWVSRLKYRDPIRTFSNGSAIGHMRKKEWLISRD